MLTPEQAKELNESENEHKRDIMRKYLVDNIAMKLAPLIEDIVKEVYP